MKIRFIFWVFIFFVFRGVPTLGQIPISNAVIDDPALNESCPELSMDGKKLLFATEIEGIKKICIAHLDSSQKLIEKEFPTELNALFSAFTMIQGISISNDAQRIYFSANLNNDSTRSDIFYSDLSGKKWSKPQKLSDKINSVGDELSPSISYDGRRLYFIKSVLNIEGETIYKICYAEINPDDSFSEISFLPASVSQGEEISVKICADSKTLYFSSRRKMLDQANQTINKGGTDLYMTKEIASGVWIDPVIMNFANTASEEMFPTVSYDGANLFYSTGKVEKKKILGGIYKMALPAEFKSGKIYLLHGNITDLYSGQSIQGQITITDPVSFRHVSTFKCQSDGSYSLVFPSNLSYILDYSKNEYSHHFFDYSTSHQSSLVTLKDVKLWNKVRLILNVFDAELFEPYYSQITTTDKQNGTAINVKTQKLAPGRFLLELPIGKEFEFKITKKHFETFSFFFDLRKSVQFEEFERDVELLPKKREVELSIYNSESKEAMEVEVFLYNKSRNETIRTRAVRNDKGAFTVLLREGDVYEIIVVPPKGFAAMNNKMELDSAMQRAEMKLMPLTAKAKIVLNNISFEKNSAEIKIESFSELDRLVMLMTDNPQIKVEISAHTDDIGTNQYNLLLSEKRANSVMNYLIENQIPNGNLISKGYGESIPAFPNDNEKNRALNRRVEMKVVEVME